MTRKRISRCRGYTLVELLVVVMILIILVAAALPVVRGVMEDGKNRAAALQLNGYLAMARAYAARNNRPSGLWLEYDPPVGYVDPTTIGDPTLRQVTRVYLAEVPPPYAGSTMSARGKLRANPVGSNNYFFHTVDTSVTNPSNDNAELGILDSLVEVGEGFLCRFDYKGDWYAFTKTAANVFAYQPGSSSVRPPGYGTTTAAQQAPGKPFQILRSARRVGSPLELPAGACIDIEYSGLGPTGFDMLPDTTYPPAVDHGFGAGNNRLVLLFNPSGAVDTLYVDSAALAVTGTIHFLIGKIDKVNLPYGASTHVSGINFFNFDTSNLADPNSLWVSIGRLNGSVTTSENMPDVEHAAHSATPWDTDGQEEYLEECRQVATGREQMAGQ